MRESSTWRPKVLAASVLSAAALAAAPSAASASWASALYVNGKATAGHADSSCSSAGYTTIDAAVSAAGAGTSIIVCPGTYNEGVLLQKRISLVGWAP